MEAETSAKKQRGRPFPKGVSGNPSGRPIGSISIMGKLKQMWADNPADLDAFVMEIRKDKTMRKEILQQIDGAPAKKLDITSGGEKITFGVINFDDYDPVSAPTE